MQNCNIIITGSPWALKSLGLIEIVQVKLEMAYKFFKSKQVNNIKIR